MLRLACCRRSTKKNERAVDEKKLMPASLPILPDAGFFEINACFSPFHWQNRGGHCTGNFGREHF